jgi:hypothetical protein
VRRPLHRKRWKHRQQSKGSPLTSREGETTLAVHVPEIWQSTQEKVDNLAKHIEKLENDSIEMLETSQWEHMEKLEMA